MVNPINSRVGQVQRSADAQSINTLVNQVIAQEALSNERKFAYVRVIVLVISSSLDLLVFLFPKALIGVDSVSPAITLFGWSGCLIATGFLIALLQPSAWRRLPVFQIAIPLLDGLLLAGFITNIWWVLSMTKPQIIANIAAFSCLLAVSGGIRIYRRSLMLTTVLALANFTYAAILFRLDIAVSFFVLFTILGMSMVGILTSNIVRRQGKNEAGRLLMQQFLPANVVEAAFETPINLLEEPRVCDVTIMVTDLRGFTNYAERLDPVAVLEFLSQLQGLLARIVEQHGGWVDKFMGDGMLAVFGAPQRLENHADQALLAAQTILAEVTHLSPLPLGIGLHSGPVVAGCLGTDGHLEFTVIGDTVNVASRLESLTKQMNTPLLISQTTQQKLKNQVLQPLGAIPIRGRDQGLHVFTLAINAKGKDG